MPPCEGEIKFVKTASRESVEVLIMGWFYIFIICLFMLINLKDFLNANVEKKTEFARDFSSEVLSNPEQYVLLQYMEQHGAIAGVIFKKEEELENTIKTDGAKLVELQDKLRAFDITDEEREQMQELECEFFDMIRDSGLESVELGSCRDPFKNTGLILL